MNPFDRAQKANECFIEDSLEKQRRKHSHDNSSKQKGFCLYCNAKLAVGVYCDDDCREDHEAELISLRIQGK